MIFAYLTGQRPSDVLSITWSDLKNNTLIFRQAKTGTTVRIAVVGQLLDVLNRIRKRTVIGTTIISNNAGRKIPLAILQRTFKDARDRAETIAKASNIPFTPFQFRDIRAKAASDADSQTSAQKLLGHKDITTTTIYRRDKEEIIPPLMFSMKK